MKSSKTLITIAAAGLLSISTLSVLAHSKLVKLGEGSGVMSTVGSCPLTPKMVSFHLDRNVLTLAKSLPVCVSQYRVNCSINPLGYNGSVNIQTGSSPQWNFDLTQEVLEYYLPSVNTYYSESKKRRGLWIQAQWFPHNAVKQKSEILVTCSYAPTIY